MGEGRAFEVAGREVAIFRTREGALYATQATCPHQRGPLVDGLVGGMVLVCPLHAFKFELGSGRPLENACPALITYPVELSPDGEVLLSLASELPPAQGCAG
jgi:nitrite reductase (NADH) small subunit